MKWSEMSERERDALVCAQVMGLSEAKTIWYSAMKVPCYCVTEDGVDIIERDGESYSQYGFRPSTSIADAWQVVEKFPLFTVERVELFLGNITHIARCWNSVEEAEFIAEAKAAPEAICIAALKACGVEIEQ